MVDNLLDVITKVAWILLSTYTIIFFVRTAANRGIRTAFAWLYSVQVLAPLLIVINLTFLSAALVFIEPPEVGVVISLLWRQGVRDRPFSSGLHWIIPFAERVEIYPIYWQTYTMSSKPAEGQEFGDDSIRARTSDGQEVLLDCSIIFRIDSKQAVRVHIDWQKRYIEDLIRPVIRGFVRTEVSQFQVAEVNSSARRDLENTLDKKLRDEFGDKGLIVDQFVLRDITFSDEYAASIESKQVYLEYSERAIYEAEQFRRLAQGRADAIKIEAQGRADAIVIEAKARSEALETEAQGQAEAFKLIGESLKENRDVLTNEYIQKLSPNIRVMLLPNNAPLILPLPELEEPLPLTTTLNISPTLSTNSTTNTGLQGN